MKLKCHTEDGRFQISAKKRRVFFEWLLSEGFSAI